MKAIGITSIRLDADWGGVQYAGPKNVHVGATGPGGQVGPRQGHVGQPDHRRVSRVGREGRHER